MGCNLHLLALIVALVALYVSKGDGPMGTVRVTGNHKAEVRVMCGNPNVDMPLRPDGKLDVGSAIGKGNSSSTKPLSSACKIVKGL